MSRGTNAPRVVAELGRPETPEETAARKAENSRNHRARQTANNLVFSLLATVGLVIVIVLMVPRSDEVKQPDVDFTAIAAEAQVGIPETLVVPHLPTGWHSNLAQLRPGADGVQSWYIGLLTPAGEYIGLTQGLNANTSWLSDQLNKAPATGEQTIDGVSWTIYDNRTSSIDFGNAQYAMSTKSGDNIVALYGSADDAEFRTLAEGMANQIKTNAQVVGNGSGEVTGASQ